MRIVVHGQQAFGKAVLEALLERGEDVVAVYGPPEGGRPDPLVEAAEAAGAAGRAPGVAEGIRPCSRSSAGSRPTCRSWRS